MTFPMRRFRFGFGAPIAAAVLLAVWFGAGFVSAQGAPVRINGAIDKLSKGKSLAGAIMYDFSLYAAAQFASSDLDFMIIDMEHRGLDFERLETFLLGTTNKAEIAKQGNLQVRVPPIVRIPTYGRAPNEAIVKQVLDMGAFGIMFPAIENKQQALEAVSSARYPQLKGSKYPNPVGRRGNGNMPAAWFWGLTRPEYSLRADIWPANPDGEILLFLQVETAEGVKNINDILSVPGIGVLFVGPNDLSWSLGVPQGSPEHEEAVQVVLDAARARNIPAAITVTEKDVLRRLKQGFRIASLPSGGLEQPMDATLKLARTVIGR
jgi:4-hydroxy-2-oxoheptanedioate aldolase